MPNQALKRSDLKDQSNPPTPVNIQVTPHFFDSPKHSEIPIPFTCQYEFALFYISQKCYYGDISVSFKPLWNPDLKFYQRIFPVYNCDGNFWSPAFIIPDDMENSDSWKASWNLRKKEFITKSESEEETIKLPQNNDTSHCSVCLCKYEDYWEHIKSIRHRNRIKESLGQKYIQRFARRIKKSRKRAKDLKTN